MSYVFLLPDMEISPINEKWYYSRNFLVIHPVSTSIRLIYVAFCLMLTIAVILIFFVSAYYKFGLLFAIAWLLLHFWQKLIPPGNFFPVRISTVGQMVSINRKRFN